MKTTTLSLFNIKHMTLVIAVICMLLSGLFIPTQRAEAIIAPDVDRPTTTELQQLIANLMAQIAALQAQIGVQPTPGTGNGGPCVTLTRSMYLGSKDPNTAGEVSKLQRFLKSTGDYTYPTITGYFGPATQQAVQRWQASHGVVSHGSPNTTGYGLVGAQTRKAMNASCRPRPLDNDGPSITLLSPLSLSEVYDKNDAGSDVVYIKWTTDDLPQNSDVNVIIEIEVTERYEGSSITGSIAQVVATDGEGLRKIGIATDGTLDPGEYRVRTYLQDCHPSGCQYSSLQEDLKVYDYSGWGKFTILGDAITVTEGSAEVLYVEYSDSDETLEENDDATDSDDMGVFELEFEITALDDDIYLPFGSHRTETIEDSIIWEILDSNELVVSTGITTDSLDAAHSNTEESNSYLVREADTEEFILEVTFDPEFSGKYKLRLVAVQYNTVDDNEATETLDVSDDEIETGWLTIDGVDLDVDDESDIVVTAPNGGEEWEIAQLNTVTWAPYGYNPTVNGPRDVKVYLEIKTDAGFHTVGRVMDTGKASLHTYFRLNDHNGTYAEPGEYYVRVVNTETGEEDRSDQPFTLLKRGIDIKVNGSDGPVTLANNEPITVTFDAGDSFTRCSLSGARESVNGGYNFDVGIGAAFNGYAYAPNEGSFTSVRITCYKSDGTTRKDSVLVKQEGTASAYAKITVTEPNGAGNSAQIIDVNQSTSIKFTQEGISSYSIALYKNDTWQEWIVKDVSTGNSSEYSYNWNPADMEKEMVLGQGSYKIYITGVRSDGAGYVDDKSDSAFGFADQSIPESTDVELTASLSANYRDGVTNGEIVTIRWDADDAPTGATVSITIPEILNGDDYSILRHTSRLDGSYNWKADFEEQYLPYIGELQVAVYDSTGELLKKKTAGITVKSGEQTQVSGPGVYQGYSNGVKFISTDTLTKGEALVNCILAVVSDRTKAIKCTWDGEILYQSTPAGSVLGASTTNAELQLASVLSALKEVLNTIESRL